MALCWYDTNIVGVEQYSSIVTYWYFVLLYWHTINTVMIKEQAVLLIIDDNSVISANY